MAISTRFSVGIHILSLIATDEKMTSDLIAGSVNTNPVVIRKIMGMLKKADLIEVRPGVAGARLARPLSRITLLDVYHAVAVVPDKELFGVHTTPNPDCLVGRNIQSTVKPIFELAQSTLEKVLAHVTLDDIVSEIEQKEASSS
ncbi:Rrf2 family transcriptional regulator [Exiguobacterium acetylicum]